MMNQDETLYDSPVASLQTMLRQLAQIYDFLPLVPIDGIFDQITLEAVVAYQREKCPPATGVVTETVWNTLRQDYYNHLSNQSPPRKLRAYPEGEMVLQTEEENGHIALFQSMFLLLSQKIHGITPEPPTGTYSQTSKKNVLWLQQVSGLPTTGLLDRQSWDRLSRLYELYVTMGE